MANKERVALGRLAMHEGSADYFMNDQRTNGIDTIANVLHALASEDEFDAQEVLHSAYRHFQAEQRKEP